MIGKKAKLVYDDSSITKVLWGGILSEDDFFISFETEDGNLFRVNKQKIISIKFSSDHSLNMRREAPEQQCTDRNANSSSDQGKQKTSAYFNFSEVQNDS